jgi:hypothetical protein
MNPFAGMLALQLIIASTASAIAMECASPPQQFTEKVGVDGKAQAEGLVKKIVGGSIEGKLSVVADDLLSRYPDAGRNYESPN